MFESWKTLSPEFKRYLVPAGLFSLAYFSFGFLLLRAYSVGFVVKDIVLLYALFNIAFVVAAPLIGKLGDRVGRARMIMLELNLIYFVDVYRLRIREHEIASLSSCLSIWCVLCNRRSPKQGIYRRYRVGTASVRDWPLQFRDRLIYLPASLIAGALWLLHLAQCFCCGCMPCLHRVDGVHVLASRSQALSDVILLALVCNCSFHVCYAESI